jgi:thiol:disulfide interchange protein DsbD
MNHLRHIPTHLLSLLLSLLASTVLASTALGAPDVPDSAYGEGAVDGDDPRVETRLLVDHSQVKPGEKLRVGVLYTLDPDWHVYWRNSGDAGLSTDTEFSSKNASFGELQWPAPKVFVDPAGEVYTFGYSDQVLFFADATVAEDASGELTINAEVDYLACKIDCIPGNSKLTRTVPVVADTSAPNAEAAPDEIVELFETASGQLPQTEEQLGLEVEAVYSQTPIRPGDSFRAAIAIDYCPGSDEDCQPYQIDFEHRKYAFLPDTTAQASLEVIGLRNHPEAEHGQLLDLEGRANASAPRDDERLSGIVHLTSDDGTHVALLVDEAIPRGPEGADVSAVESPLLGQLPETPGSQTPEVAAAGEEAPGKAPARAPIALWKALLLAFLGGMILNLMPCVFPVLAIKVSSFTQVVHESKSHILSHGMAYTGGIVSSMLALALVVLGLREAGTQVGWGFQFQEPLFIAALCAILVLFALNLFGVFEVSVSPNELANKTHQASGMKRSFGEGVLAVILATPCSAPFLGTAVGFALASSAPTILAIFLMLGLGLAAPFVLLTMVPGAAKVLPRPGAWMNVLKEILGFALLGTVIWLFWILGQMTGSAGIVQVLIFLSALALGAWFFGKIQYREEGARKWLMTLLAAALVAGVGVYVLDFERTQKTSSTTAVAEGDIDWREWNEEAVQKELAAGRVVFVDFTADWCITCKVNERTIIDTDRVKKAIADNDVATFKADWTNPDERIRKKLAEYGKGGVPMYLVYDPEHPNDPQVLPEVLTVDLLVEAFGK